jgi:hypothetical protein
MKEGANPEASVLHPTMLTFLCQYVARASYLRCHSFFG